MGPRAQRCSLGGWAVTSSGWPGPSELAVGVSLLRVLRGSATEGAGGNWGMSPWKVREAEALERVGWAAPSSLHAESRVGFCLLACADIHIRSKNTH